MDIFAYKFLSNYPDNPKPIQKYLILELKKSKANKDTILQLMRYVDWICKEYASGDYSLIKARVIAKGYNSKGLHETLTDECVRSFISSTHPNVSSKWNEIELMDYSIDTQGQIQLSKYDSFDKDNYLKSVIQKLGWNIGTTNITKNGTAFKIKYKIQKKKIVFLESNSMKDADELKELGWTCINYDLCNTKQEIDELIKTLVE